MSINRRTMLATCASFAALAATAQSAAAAGKITVAYAGSMGVVMDQIMVRADSIAESEQEVRSSLERLAPHCRWTSGEWEELGLKWNQVQSTSQDIKRLSEHLCRLDRKLARVNARGGAFV